MKCPKCANVSTGKSTFCSNCGIEIAKRRWWFISFRDGSETGCVGVAEQVSWFANRHNLKPGEILIFPPLLHDRDRVDCIYFAAEELKELT